MDFDKDLGTPGFNLEVAGVRNLGSFFMLFIHDVPRSIQLMITDRFHRRPKHLLGYSPGDRQAMMGHAGGSRITNDVYTTYSPDVTAAEIREIYGDFLPEF